MYLAGNGTLEDLARQQAAYEECKALETILGPCQMTPPPTRALPDLETTAYQGFPWWAVVVGYVLLARAYRR